MTYLVFLGGVVVGSIITNIIFNRRKTFGTLDIDHSNPDKDVYQIRLDKFDDLTKRKKVVLKINNDADLSQR